jgi:hypothetical protein
MNLKNLITLDSAKISDKNEFIKHADVNSKIKKD